MPLWRIYHPEGTFGDLSERQGLAQAITKIYVDNGLPPFYVAVIFVQVPAQSIFRAGELQPSESKPPFIRFVFDNIARAMPAGRSERKLLFFEKVNAAVRPYTEDRGWDWEVHGEETDITLNRINSLEMPPEDHPAFSRWREENRPTPYER